MPWVKIDDGFFDNETNRRLGPAGRDLFLACLTYCAKGLTDGRIPREDVRMILAAAQAKPATLRRLVELGRLNAHENGYEIANYLAFQPSRDTVLAKRQKDAEKKRRQRAASPRDGDSGQFVPLGTPPGTNGHVPRGVPPVRPSVPDPTPHRTLTRGSPGTPPRPDLKPVSAVLAERPDRPPSDELLAGITQLRNGLHPTTDDAA